jgi:23S rRNA (pseudouridine1915-N3)-methyltransferase
MKIVIISVGKKNSPELDILINNYQKRLAFSKNISWLFIKPSPLPASEAKEKESAEIIKNIPPKTVVWLLDETGRQLNNEQLATELEEAMQQKNNSLRVIIGGPYGVNENIKQRADFVWSLSKLVLPHQLVRLFLIEQLYRSAEISKNSAYHHV